MNKIENIKKIEEKWQKEWEEKKAFEAKIDENKKKFFITVAFPYMNGKPHLGHLFTYLRTDFHARLRRLQGYNVLYPQGWHCTGSPIVANALKVREKDEKILKMLEKLGVPKEKWENFKDPVEWINYFKPYWKEAFKRVGFSIDWSREFITTELNPYYSKFVEWQYLTLKEKGLIYKGKHPVVWCPKEKKVIGDHDRSEGEGIQPEEVVVIKFEMDSQEFTKKSDLNEEIIKEIKNKKIIFPATTYRPETVYGVENLWINPNSKYYLVKKENELWILSNLELKEELEFDILAEIEGKKLLNKKVKNPVTNEIIEILPAEFVNPEFGTGVVMSVPAHAPYDYIALIDLGKKPKMKFLIEVNGKKNLVEEIIKKLGIKSQKDKELLEKATKEVYKKEFHKGIFLIEPYKGLKVSEAKEKVKEELLNKGVAEKIYILPEEVICRCGAKGVVKIVENQWFIKYSDPEWKKKAHELVDEMRFWPKELRDTFHKVIDWLKDWVIAHDKEKELGTPLPWDKSQVVESLSDSTVYMAYYTLAKYLQPESPYFIGVKPEQLTKEFFDFIFLDKGTIEEISKKTGIKKEDLLTLKKEFEYWYPLDTRHSGKDLIQNHLSFFIFHHVALFKRKDWPRGIAVNGFVLLNGQKMSKSKGNFITIEEALEKWGAEILRFLVALAGDSTLDDGNLDTSIVNRLQDELLKLIEEIPNLYFKEEKEENEIIEKAFVAYFISKLEEIEKELNELNFRSALTNLYFNLFKELKTYSKYLNSKVKQKLFEEWLKFFSIFAPHISEEIWHKIGKNNFISLETFNYKNIEINNKYRKAIEYIDNLIEKILEFKKLLEKKGNKVEKVEIYLSTKENHELANYLINKKFNNFKELIQEIKKERPELMKEINKLKILFANKFLDLADVEKEVIEGFKEIIEQKTGLKVEIKGVDKAALPGRPKLNLV
jgi:leucyl-tRNA synthetase